MRSIDSICQVNYCFIISSFLVNIFLTLGFFTPCVSFDSAFLLQQKDNLVFHKKKLKCVTKNKPSRKELKDIEFAFRICKYVKSNAIVIVKDSSMIEPIIKGGGQEGGTH